MVVTVTTSFLSKPSDLDVLGLSASADGNQVLLTIQDDGVVAYDVAHQARTSAWVAGSSTSFGAPTVWCGKHLVAVLRPHGALQASLACCDAGNTRLDDSQHRMPLESEVIALCSIHSHAAAAVCNNGTIVAAVADDSTAGATPRWTTATCGDGAVVEAAQAHAGVLHVICRATDAQQRHLQSFALSEAGELQRVSQAVLQVGTQPPLACVGGVIVTRGGRVCLRWSHATLQVFTLRGAAPSMPPLFSLDLASHLRTGPAASELQSVLLSEGVVGVLGWQQAEDGGSGLQMVVVDVRYGQLLGNVPLADAGASGTALHAGDGRGGLRALAVQGLPGGRAMVAVCGALLLVACSGVSARLSTLVGSQQHTAASEQPPTPLLHAPAYFGSAASVGVGAVDPDQSHRWQAHLAWPLQDPGVLLPAVPEDIAAADLAAMQQLQHTAPGKLAGMVDAALQASLSAPTVAVLACRLAATRGWAPLQRLAAAGCIPSLALAPGVLSAAAEAQQHTLVTALMQHCVDVNPADLSTALCALLAVGLPSKASANKALANGHDHEMASSDEEAGPANGVASHAVSTAWPAALHALVRTKHDQGVLLQALRVLQVEHIVRLGEYLTEVLALHGEGRDGRHHSGAATLPSLTSAIAWSSALIDAQYTTIVLQARGEEGRPMRDVLASMHAATAQHVAVGKRLGKLKGPLEHVVSNAPLPSGQAKQRSTMVKAYQYTQVTAHDGQVQAVQLSARSCSVFASAATDGKVHVWAVGQPDQPLLDTAPLQQFAGHAGQQVTRVHFSPDGRWVASACAGGHVKLWDLTAGTLLHTFTEHSSPITDLAFSPNDAMLAASSTDALISLCALDGPHLTATIVAPAPVHAIAFAPGSTTIVAALPAALAAWTLTEPAPVPLVTVSDMQWAPVFQMQLCDDMLLAACGTGGAVGVAVVPGLTRLLQGARQGEVVRGVNKAADAGLAVESTATPSAAAAAVGKSPLQAEARSARASRRGSSFDAAGEATPGHSSMSSLRASLPTSLAAAAARNGGAEVPMEGMRALQVNTRAPSRAGQPGQLASTPTAQRSPIGKGMSDWARTQRQSTGVRDAVFNGGMPDPEALTAERLYSPAKGARTSSLDTRPLEELLPPKSVGGRAVGPRPVDPGPAWEGAEDAWGRPDEGIVSPGAALDAAAAAAAAQHEEALLEAGRSKHHTVASALRARLTNYDTVKLFWNTGDVRGVMTALKLGTQHEQHEHAQRHRRPCTDPTLACDVFECFRSNPDFFTLDVCPEAVHVVRELLETATHEKPIAVALDVLSIYVRCHGASIREGCQQDALHDVEVQAWRDRCLACRAALQGVGPQLVMVQRAHEGTHVGRKAEELQQEAACLS